MLFISTLQRRPLRCLHRRTFSSTSAARASIFYALAALSNSRETQHFNKLTKLPRMEHSPPLKLIKTSEIDTFPCPTPPRPPLRPLIRHVGGARSALKVWDERALRVGRVILSNQARHTHRLRQSLARAKRREAKLNTLSHREREAWHQERSKMRREMKAAGMWILLSIGTATALATWRFWPSEKEGKPRDSGELGRKIAARASAAMGPLPKARTRGERRVEESPVSELATQHAAPAVSIEPTMTAPIAVPVAPPKPKQRARKPSMKPVVEEKPTRSWWKSLFWKQE